MAEQKVLCRPANYLYSIRPHERRWIYAGLTSDKRQVLMGRYDLQIVAIFFGLTGILSEVQKRNAAFPEKRIKNRHELENQLDSEIAAWQTEIGYQAATIHVQKFFVLAESDCTDEGAWYRDGIGIVDYPAMFHAILTNPTEYSKEEKEHIKTTLPQWEERGQFVLWLGNDYWFDKTGECVAS